MAKKLSKNEIHQNYRKELWSKVYIAYVSSSNSTSENAGSKWADIALSEFDKRFKVTFEYE